MRATSFTLAVMLAFLGLEAGARPAFWRRRKPAATVPKPMSVPPPNPAADTSEVREAFAKGVRQFKEGEFGLAAKTLGEIPDLGGYLSLYKHWYLGQALFETNKFKEAEIEIAKITQGSPSSEMKFQAQFLWGEIALAQKKYAESVKRLSPLEKKWHSSHRFPEVEWRLMRAEFKLGHRQPACKRARILYAKFPAHPLVIGWGSVLSAVEVDGRNLGCIADKGDFADRVRSLQWAGESDKARGEIAARLGKASPAEKRDLDMVRAGFWVSEGSVEDALNLLVPYYAKEKSNLNYLTLLGRAAARSGDYQTAVGAFERAADLAKKSKAGREALFQAAYLSYQFQDYDGAARKFRQFAKDNPRSGLARDATWHLAWLQYLRGDYRGALDQFQSVSMREGSRRRPGDNLRERLRYWSAMSHVRLGELPEARGDLESIIAANAYSYYGLAAQARLESLLLKPGETPPREPAAEPKPLVPATPLPVASSVDEERESEEDLPTVTGAEPGLTPGDETSANEDKVAVSDSHDPDTRARIAVANKLIQFGLGDVAKWELAEVEKRTRNPQDLRQLIAAYEGIQSFNRSATIADQDFGGERETGGFDGARVLWSSAYPQAFKPLVDQSAKRYKVEPEWVWAIMRTESLYRPDVISPVGAKGLMQLMSNTARNLAKLDGQNTSAIDLLKPEQNIRLGAQYLGRLGDKFKNHLALVAAAYNAGPHRVESWLVNFGQLETDEFIEHIPYLETRNYVKKVVRSNTFYRRLVENDRRPAGYLATPLGVAIPAHASTKESWDSP